MNKRSGLQTDSILHKEMTRPDLDCRCANARNGNDPGPTTRIASRNVVQGSGAFPVRTAPETRLRITWSLTRGHSEVTHDRISRTREASRCRGKRPLHREDRHACRVARLVAYGTSPRLASIFFVKDYMEPVSKPEPKALAAGQVSMRLGKSWPAASAVGSQTRSLTVLKPLVVSTAGLDQGGGLAASSWTQENLREPGGSAAETGIQ
jgi:hypothetical protein